MFCDAGIPREDGRFIMIGILQQQSASLREQAEPVYEWKGLSHCMKLRGGERCECCWVSLNSSFESRHKSTRYIEHVITWCHGKLHWQVRKQRAHFIEKTNFILQWILWWRQLIISDLVICTSQGMEVLEVYSGLKTNNLVRVPYCKWNKVM